MKSRFFKPLTIEEALKTKSENPGSLYLGGGTEINNPASGSHGDVLISLEELNLKACVKGEHNFILGASCTFQELIDWEECYPPLKEAAGFLFSRNVRNMATLGGNIGAHLKDSYLVPVLMALDADLELAGDSVIPLEQYVSEERNDLILNVRFAHAGGQTAVKNIAKSAGGLSVLSAAVSIEQENGKITKAAIAVAGLYGRVTRLKTIEDALTGGSLKSGHDLQDAVTDAVEAEDDIRGSAAYKKYLCGVVVADCVARCMKENV